MSGLPKKLKKPMLGNLRPEDVAMKPKPSINAIGAHKRPLSNPPGSSIVQLGKKPKLDDASTSVTTSVAAQIVRPLVDTEDLQIFAAKGKCDEFEEAEFVDILNKAIEEQKYNKACRLIVAFLLKAVKKAQIAQKGYFEPEYFSYLSKVLYEHGEKLTNVYLFKVLFWTLNAIKSWNLDKQSLIFGLITRLALAHRVLNPFLAQIFVYDCLNERIWVDKPSSEQLVSLILRRFNTKFLGPAFPIYRIVPDLTPPTWIPNPLVPDKFPENINGVTEADREKERKRRRKEKDRASMDEKEDETLPPLRINVVEDVLSVLRRALEQQSELPPRALLRTLAVFCGQSEIRRLVAQRIDNWLQNPKVQKQALELLCILGCNIENINANSDDAEALNFVFRMKSMKSKLVQPVFTLFLTTIYENTDNCRASTRQLVLNELGPQATRASHNMTIFQAMFTVNNFMQTKIFAEEMCDILFERQDMLRAASTMIRELIRSQLRSEFSFARFLTAYLNRCGTKMLSGEHFNAETVITTTTAICNLLVWICISQQVRDEFTKRRQGEQYNLMTIHRFIGELNEYYESALKWIRSSYPMMFDNAGDKRDYVARLYSILFLDKGAFLMSLEGGPNEVEWAGCQRIINEIHFTSRLINLVATDPSLQQVDSIQILHLLTERLLKNWSYTEEGTIFIDGLDSSLIGLCYDLARYKSRALTNHEKPQLYIIDLFWKVNYIIFIWVCLGNTNLFKMIYVGFASIRLLMLLALTENFSLPANLLARLKEEELTMIEPHKKIISKFEMMEARNPNFTAENSELIRICYLDPLNKPFRIPPSDLCSSLNAFCKTYKIGTRLCEVRNPDILQEFIDLVGTQDAIFAITSYINRDPNAISTLSIESLSEYLLIRLIEEPDGTSDAVWIEQREKIFQRLSVAASMGPKLLIFLLEKLTLPNDNLKRTTLLMLLGRIYFWNDSSVDEKDELSFLEAISNAEYFSDINYQVLMLLVRACKYETEPARMRGYLKFIIKHLKPHHDFDPVVKFTSSLGSRTHASIKSELLDLYLTYDKWAMNQKRVPSRENLCEVHFKTSKITLDYDAIVAQIELLCTSSNADNESTRNQLIDLWFPRDGSKIVVMRQNETANLFNDALLAHMLCTEDERIVNVALSDLSPISAMTLLRRLGLAIQCASRLLAMLDTLDLNQVELVDAIKTLPFANAYRTRGSRGGDNFIEAVTQRQAATQKEELNESFICEPLPRLPTTALPPPPQLLDYKEIVNKIKAAIASGSELNFGTSEVCSIIAAEKVAIACLELVEGSLKYLLDHPDTFLQIMLMLSSAAERFPQVRSQLTIWSTRVLKGAQPPQVVAGILRNFSATPAHDAQKTINFPGAISILRYLEKHEDLNNVERASLIEHFLEKRPEIIVNNDKLKAQMAFFFASKNLTIIWLCSKLPEHCVEETIPKILKILLENFYQNLYAPSVLSFIAYCVCSGNDGVTCLIKTPQLKIIARYLCMAVSADAKLEEKALEIIKALETLSGPKILPHIIETCVIETRCTLGTPKFEAINHLISSIADKYPCIRVDMIGASCTISEINWRNEEADTQATMLLTAAFKTNVSTRTLPDIISQLEVLLKNFPKIIERQIGVLSRLLAQLVSMNAREVKDRMGLVAFAIRVLFQTIATADQDSLDHIDALISVIISFAEKHLMERRGLNETVLRTCLLYLDSHQSRAQTLFTEHSETIMRLCDGISDKYLTQQIGDALRRTGTSQ